ILLHPARDADPAGLGEALEPRRHVHAVAVDVVALGDDVPDIDPDAKRDALFRSRLALATGDHALDLDGRAQRVDHAGELRQQPVAGGLDDAPPVLGDLGIDELAPQRPQPGKRALLVRAHQAAVAGHIRGKDCREPALDALVVHGLPSPGAVSVETLVAAP